MCLITIKDVSDNRKFWKTIKPYFSYKGLNSNKLLLKEKGNLVSDEKELATIMNNFFINITRVLKKTKKLSILLKSSLFVIWKMMK